MNLVRRCALPFALALAATAAFAQSIVIAAPANFSTVVQGQSFTVEVARPVRLPTKKFGHFQELIYLLAIVEHPHTL